MYNNYSEDEVFMKNLLNILLKSMVKVDEFSNYFEFGLKLASTIIEKYLIIDTKDCLIQLEFFCKRMEFLELSFHFIEDTRKSFFLFLNKNVNSEILKIEEVFRIFQSRTNRGFNL